MAHSNYSSRKVNYTGTGNILLFTSMHFRNNYINNYNTNYQLYYIKITILTIIIIIINN